MRKIRALLWLSLALALVSCAGAPLRTSQTLQPAAAVDTQRFLGTWHIIAHIPYWPERGKVATRVEYVARADGRVDDLYYFRDTLDGPEQRWEGVAWPLDSSGARWKARFIWPFSTEFWVVEVDADYQLALIATPDAKLAWVYARSPQLDDERYAAALARLQALGVDSTRLQRIPR